MQLLLDWILPINLILSTLIFYIGARIYILPRIKEWKPLVILLPILLLHSFRHLGLMYADLIALPCERGYNGSSNIPEVKR